MLLKAIHERLGRWKAPQNGDDSPFPREALAAAALMVECARIDRDFSEEERESICSIIRDRCGLDAETADSLVGVAIHKNDTVWHDYLFTEILRAESSPEEHVHMIDRLWEIAFVDGDVHRFEAHMIKRIGKELGLEEDQIMERGAIVREQLGLGEPEA